MKLFTLVFLVFLLSACTAPIEPAAPTSGEFLTFEVTPLRDTFVTYEITSRESRLFDRWKEQAAMKSEQDKWESWLHYRDDDTFLVGELSTERVASLADCGRKAACY